MTTRVVIDFDDQAHAQAFVNWVEQNGEVQWDACCDTYARADVSLPEGVSDVIPTPPETLEQQRARIMKERREFKQAMMRERLADYVERKSGNDVTRSLF